MSSCSPSGQGSIRPPHPLTERLISRLRNLDDSIAPRGPTVLEIGPGSGRNTAALTAAGLTPVILSEAQSAKSKDQRDIYNAALSTHALLHGTPSDIADLLDVIAAQLKPNGLLYATFGSTRDARFRKGDKLGEQTFAPQDGDERGVPHTYFDEPSLRDLLAKHFRIDQLEEVRVDTIAGSWAHQQAPLRNAYHWFVEATVIKSLIGLDAFA